MHYNMYFLDLLFRIETIILFPVCNAQPVPDVICSVNSFVIFSTVHKGLASLFHKPMRRSLGKAVVSIYTRIKRGYYIIWIINYNLDK